jgi:two-component system, NarL family, sensor histidine kinase UhpB
MSNTTTKPISLLIVEDNEGDFLLFESYLNQTGLEVKDLFHVEKISEVIPSRFHVDLIFLDLSLPDSKGTDSCKQLNKILPHTPIIVLSGLSDEKTAVECISLGAQDYLLKDDLNEKLLAKSIQYSIERKKNLENIQDSVEQYELIGRITNDLVWRWDFASNEIKSPAKDFFDYACEDIDPGLNWWVDKIHPNDRIRIVSILQKFSTGVLDNAQSEYRFKGANGMYRHVFNRAFLLRDNNNQPFAVVGAMMDITDRHRLQQELAEQEMNHQKELTEASILGQEKEREQIGKELHDNINQILASVKLFLDTAMSNESMRMDLIEKSKENILYAIEEIRKLSHSLVPASVGEQGLLFAVQELVDEINLVGLFRLHLITDDFEEVFLNKDIKLVLYRIIQEQLNNIVKYAKARNATLFFCMKGNEITLKISDDGVGFDTTKKAKGIGLKNIESRVSYYSGSVNIESSPGSGTSLQIQMPFEDAYEWQV